MRSLFSKRRMRSQSQSAECAISFQSAECAIFFQNITTTIISVLRRLHPVSRKFSGNWTKFEDDLRRLNPVSRITSDNWTKFEETITTLLMIVYYNLYLILHTFAHILHHVEVGGMWKHLVFPWKYFYKHSSEQL